VLLGHPARVLRGDEAPAQLLDVGLDLGTIVAAADDVEAGLVLGIPWSGHTR
jgi:beta-lactam-binding protein with PASTA domain